MIMQVGSRAILVTLMSLLSLAQVAWPADSVPLGSADFMPTAERPLGWRGDGTGLYPGANPPLAWSRRVAASAVTGAAYQAKKPLNDGPPAAADAQPLELGIIKDWLVLGPFAAEDPEKDIEKAFIADEATITPNENDKAAALAWKPLHTSIDTQSTHYTNEGTCNDFNVDFVYLYGRVNNQVAYGHTYIYSPSGGPVKLSIRHFNAAAKIWVNGQPTVLKPKDYNDTFNASITLNKGWNRLLVKLSAAESTRPEGQNAWVSKWRFAAYLSATLPAKYETKNIAWMAKLPGFSASSPVVVGDRLYAACGTSDLVCLSKKDGRVLWLTTCTPCDAATEAEKDAPGYKEKVEPLAASLKQADEILVGELNSLNALQGVPQDKQSKVDNLIRQKHDLEKKLHDALKALDPKKYVPLYINEVSASNGTPCTDGKRVYVVMGGGSKGPGAYLFAAYTLDGQRVWSYHEALGAAEHGNHTSPALVEGKLIYGNMGLLLALDAATGKVAWRNTLAKDSPHFWDVGNLVACTFVPYRAAGVPVLVAAPARILRASDGQVLAQSKSDLFFDGLTTPLLSGGMMYCDGGKAFQAVQLPASADAGAKGAWKLDHKQWRMESSSDFSIASGIIVNGVCYSIDTMGGLTAIDLSAQKVLYLRRLEMYQRANRQVFGFTASPALGGKYLDIFDNTGCAVVLEPGPQFKPAGRNIIENQVAGDWQDYKQEMFYAAPIFDGPAIYLKGSEYLYCIREK
jgi:outer membrane protein assembly factor BamB